MADQWGGVVSVSGNSTTNSFNPRNQPNPDFGGGYQQHQQQYGHGYGQQEQSPYYQQQQQQQQNNNYALSTSVRRGNGYSPRLTSPRSAQPQGGAATYSNALIVNEHGVGPNRRELLAMSVSDPSKMGEVMGRTTESNVSYLGLIVGEGVDNTFWRPGRNGSTEVGLLEALHLRGEDYNQDILVSSRPKEELECNFSTPDGRLFNINHDRYKYSRTKLAMRSLNGLPDDGMVHAGAMKEGLRDALPRMVENEYHLMVYRDYSDWAVKNYWKEAKKDNTLSRKYVEKCFALCVGADAGTFIPITRQQMLRGVDALVRLAATSHEDDRSGAEGQQQASSTTLQCFALSKSQYDALNVKRGPANEPGYAESAGHGHRHGGAGGHMYPSDYPSPWDWTPGAVQRRIGYYLEQKYKAVGQFIVKGLIVIGVGYVVVGYITSSGSGGRNKNNNTYNNNNNGYNNEAPRSRFARHQARMQQNQYGGNNNNSSEGNSGPSFLSALVNPKAMFDYVLAPK